MPLRLSATELTAALEGLSADERAELYGLLETRERLAAEAPVDDREPMEEIIKRMNAETAAASVDPEAWFAAQEAHRRSHDAHYAILSKDRIAHPCDDIEAFLRSVLETMSEADALARADGFPPASEVVPPAPSRSVHPRDGVDAERLPTATRRDVEQTQAVRSWSPGAVSCDSEDVVVRRGNVRVVHEWDRYLNPPLAEDR